jgi:hypothetical protein
VRQVSFAGGDSVSRGVVVTARRMSELDEAERRREYKRRYLKARREARISREKANPIVALHPRVTHVTFGLSVCESHHDN